MCDIGTALKVGGAVMEKKAEMDEQNARAAATSRSAINSMNVQGSQANVKFEEENRTALQEAYDLAMQNRANEAKFLVQAVENGVEGISVNEGYLALKNTSARGNIRFDQEAESRKAAHMNQMAGLAAQAGSRINAAAPTTSMGDVLLAGATTGISAASDAGYFEDFKIG